MLWSYEYSILKFPPKHKWSLSVSGFSVEEWEDTVGGDTGKRGCGDGLFGKVLVTQTRGP